MPWVLIGSEGAGCWVLAPLQPTEGQLHGRDSEALSH